MTFLTPSAGLVALAALAALAAFFLGRRRSEALRRTLALPPTGRRSALVRPVLVTVGLVLLGLAAAQPALERRSHVRVRRDVQALFVIDTSRSMAAAGSPRSRTRLDRAVAAAVRLRGEIPGVEAGIATLTDRVLPDLLPVPDSLGFDAVAERAVRIESPPPRTTAVNATTYDALADVARGNLFAPSAARRLVVLLTDGETRPVQTADVARALPAAEGYRFAAIRFWRGDESVYGPDGTAEPGYRPDPSGRSALHDLAAALGGRSFEEAQVRAAAAYLRAATGRGPTVRVTAFERRRATLAPYVALAGLAALLAGLAVSALESAGVRSVRL